MKVLKITLIVIQSTLLLLSLLAVSLSISNGRDLEANKGFHNFQYYYTVILFSVFLITYLSMFVLLVIRLKAYYPKFYFREKSKVRKTKLVSSYG